MNTFTRISQLTGIALAFGFALPSTAQIDDAAIRSVLIRVANRQLRATVSGSAPRTLADGSYPLATTLTDATDAAKPAGIEWDYPWGVNLYGLLQAYRATGNTNYLNFVLDHNRIVGRYYFWLRSLHDSLVSTSGLSSFQQSTALREFFILDRLDYCGSMTAQMLEGVLRYSDAITVEQLEMAQTTARWIAGGGQSRLPDGTLWRTNASPNYTIWADDLYMSCPFLIRWYQYTGDPRYLDDAARQITNMAGYLQDTDGLWFHGYFYNTHSVSGYKWGRANGWAMVATVETLSVMPTNHPARPALLDILRRHIEGVKAVQAPSGMWRQILNDPTLWEETSCSAMFSYSIARAVNRGWIDATNLDVARRAFAGISQHVDQYGAVLDTCRGTGIGTTRTFYLNRSRPYDDMHGRGAVMLAAAEILLHPKLGVAAEPGGAAVSWHAGIPDATLECSSNLVDWAACGRAPATTAAWENLVEDSEADSAFYRLHLASPAYPEPPLEFEAEALAWTANGASATVSSTDTNASGGEFITLDSDTIGDYLEFTLTNVPAGEYRLKFSFKSGPDRGQVAVTVDGQPAGSPVDEYWYATSYPLIDLGSIDLDSSGNHTVRLTVAGKHAASAGYIICADRFLLVPR